MPPFGAVSRGQSTDATQRLFAIIGIWSHAPSQAAAQRCVCRRLRYDDLPRATPADYSSVYHRETNGTAARGHQML